MKKYLIISVLFLMAACAIAQTATDNPYGAQYPSSLRRAAKSTPITFTLQTYAMSDTGASGALRAITDTISANGSRRQFVWFAPFDCKVDSFYFNFNGLDTLVNADTAGNLCWRLRVISDTLLGTGVDTLRFDSTVTASFGSSIWKRPFGKWRPRGGPDSANNIVLKGEYLRFHLNYSGAVSSKATFYGSFMVTPTDRAK